MYNIPDTKEKILCSVLYICPLLPQSSLIFLLISFSPIVYFIYARSRNLHLKDFIKYHCFQAVLLNMVIFFLPDLFHLLVSFLANIFELIVISLNSLPLPEFVKNLIASSGNLIDALQEFTLVLLGFYSVLIKVLAIYAAVWTFRGKYTYVPPISQAVNQLLR